MVISMLVIIFLRMMNPKWNKKKLKEEPMKLDKKVMNPLSKRKKNLLID